MAECNIDKCCFEDVKVCVKVNSVNGIKPNADGEVDIDESFVTTYSPQTIHGHKTFTNTIETNGMNTEAMLTTMNGLKIDTAPIVTNKSSIKWNDKEQNEVSSVEVSRPANTKDTCISLSANTITEWGSNEKASVEVHAKAGAISYATAPTPSSNATGNEIVTAEWVIDKGLADDSNVVHKSGNETINGIKTFTNGTWVTNNSTTAGYSVKNTAITRNEVPSQLYHATFRAYDKNDKILGEYCIEKSTTGCTLLNMNVRSEDSNGNQLSESLYFNLANDGSAARFYPSSNNKVDLGMSNNKWANAYITYTYTNRVTTYSIAHPTDDSYLFMCGGSDYNKGATLYLGGIYAENFTPGRFALAARKTDGSLVELAGSPNGSLTWGGKNVAIDENLVHRTGDETISGVKTFNNVYTNDIHTYSIDTKYITHTHDGGACFLSLPEHSGKVALQERTRANAEPVNRTLLYECAGGLNLGDITLNNMYTKYNALVIVYSNDDGGAISTYYLDCAELDIRREVAGSGTFLLVDGHSYWACTGASTGTKFVHSANNGLRIHKIYGLAEFY